MILLQRPIQEWHLTNCSLDKCYINVIWCLWASQSAEDQTAFFQVLLIHKVGHCYSSLQVNTVSLRDHKAGKWQSQNRDLGTRVSPPQGTSQSGRHCFPPSSMELPCPCFFLEAHITQRRHTNFYRNWTMFPSESGEWEALRVGEAHRVGQTATISGLSLACEELQYQHVDCHSGLCV